MTITENQRRTLDLMAESAGWNWADVEALSEEEFGECVAGLTYEQAFDLQDWILRLASVGRMAMQAHDDPELRRQVREQLLYPTKPRQEPMLNALELACLCGGWRRGKSVAYLSQRYGIPEAIVQDVVGWADETAA